MSEQAQGSLIADGVTVEEWRCAKCRRFLMLVYLNLRDGEVILERTCLDSRCKALNTLTRIAGPSLPTNGQGRLGPASNRAVVPNSAQQGGPHAKSSTRQS